MAGQPLTFDVLDDFILAHERDRTLPVCLQPGPCLGSIVELVRFCEESGQALDYTESRETAGIRRALESRRPVYLNDRAAGFIATRRAEYKGGDIYWDSFMFSMHKAMLAAGFSSAFSRGLVGAMDEMQNNVHDHSNAIDTGVVAYRVGRDRVEWVVADRGIGVLSSLRSGAFPSLTDSGEALKIALTDGR